MKLSFMTIIPVAICYVGGVSSSVAHAFIVQSSPFFRSSRSISRSSTSSRQIMMTKANSNKNTNNKNAFQKVMIDFSSQQERSSSLDESKQQRDDEEEGGMDTCTGEWKSKASKSTMFSSSLLIAACLISGASSMVYNPDVALASSSTSSLSLPSSFVSSSIQLSQTITTMDMSLPSSYDKISDANASAKQELTLETNVITNASKKKATTTTTTKKTSNNNKSTTPTLTDEEKASIAAEKKAERDAITAEKAAEKEALALQKVEENARRDAERAVERAEKKAAAKAAKELREQEEDSNAKANTQKYKDAEFVDFSLPSYEKAASVNGQK